MNEKKRRNAQNDTKKPKKKKAKTNLNELSIAKKTQ